MVFEGGGDGDGGGVVVFHVGDAGFKDVADFPEAGAFVHVFIEPLFSNRQVEFLDDGDELGMERLEGRENMLEEMDGHGVMGVKRSNKFVEALSDEVVEAIDGGGGGSGGGGTVHHGGEGGGLVVEWEKR